MRYRAEGTGPKVQFFDIYTMREKTANSLNAQQRATLFQSQAMEKSECIFSTTSEAKAKQFVENIDKFAHENDPETGKPHHWAVHRLDQSALFSGGPQPKAPIRIVVPTLTLEHVEREMLPPCKDCGEVRCVYNTNIKRIVDEVVDQSWHFGGGNKQRCQKCDDKFKREKKRAETPQRQEKIHQQLQARSLYQVHNIVENTWISKTYRGHSSWGRRATKYMLTQEELADFLINPQIENQRENIEIIEYKCAGIADPKQFHQLEFEARLRGDRKKKKR